jgi:hypothetical protein
VLVVLFADLYAAHRVDVRKPFQTVHFACQAHEPWSPKPVGGSARKGKGRMRSVPHGGLRERSAMRACMPASSAIVRHQRHETRLQMQTLGNPSFPDSGRRAHTHQRRILRNIQQL